MPKHKKSEDEDDSEIPAEDSQNLCIQKEIIERTNLKKREEETEYEELIENLLREFIEYWRNPAEPHPGILYHLTFREAFYGFELYYTNFDKFEVWYHNNEKIRIVAPLPINLPANYDKVFENYVPMKCKKYRSKKPLRKIGKDRYDILFLSDRGNFDNGKIEVN